MTAEWCTLAEAAFDVGEAFIEDGAPDATASEQELALERAQAFVDAEPPEPIAEDLRILREGPPPDDPARYDEAVSNVGDFAQETCDLDPELFEPAP